MDVGTRQSHYTITAKIGEGGMGQVFRAEESASEATAMGAGWRSGAGAGGARRSLRDVPVRRHGDQWRAPRTSRRELVPGTYPGGAAALAR